MVVYEICPDVGNCNTHTEKTIKATLSAVAEWLEGSEIGTVVSIKLIEMTEEEYNNLPEYMGP